MPERMSKDTLRAQVKKYILKQISTGVYQPGERVVETRVAKELQISQAPVREAILELSLMGVLEERPYSGSFVNTMGTEDIESHYNIRAMLEAYAAHLAAKNATEEDLRYMRFILNEMDECSDYENFTDIDNKFHEAIIRATGNRVLRRIWASISTYEWTYEAILATKQTLEELRESHREIYKVIASRKANASGAVMYLHIEGFKEAILSALEETEKGES